ncbi:GNAT family N-acetyltransferase [Clostridium estertheticum]|uniref:GNAT family N-acetyltransferase n=1 Tax=Clostridium estertheticum TaxID=238834 RepID=UPI001C7DD1A7|nr:GNAT family N-acetyltransferase [Clostridium estertheticum]MBX4264381.1 GNAT family N-acetyltransferase [Clostridium estertheticum]MBX4267963.1 GNAT family N-acetyltransferase [Clostridium estertheticum]WLC78191.1 GNAT family N-acetyltransferase [Clostridium estertheticum]WLC89223.1 GNAT family N-acetyltransferase [Clostridium estertheticum]
MLVHRGTRIIETNRLILRPFVVDDATNMFNNWSGDPEVAKHLSWQAHSDITDTKGIMQIWIDSYSSKRTYHWGVVCKDNRNQVIGSIGAVAINDCLEQAEIGYCISKKYWNKGITSEALVSVIDYLFSCGFMRISAYHDVLNPASGKVMQKCGMQFEGIFRNAQKNNVGEFCSIAQYAILKSDPR